MDDGRHFSKAANISAWASRSPNMPPVAEEEMGADVDEPPERATEQAIPAPSIFQKTTIRKPSEGTSSLLTRALSYHPEDDAVSHTRPVMLSSERRRSMTSNVSLASTADLTSDTGLTSPSRANTPSPPPPDMSTLCIQEPPNHGPKLRFGQLPVRTAEEMAECAPRKKSITFACLAKPEHKSPDSKPSRPQQDRPAANANANANANTEAPRKPCIKFACPAPRSDAPAQGGNEKPNNTATRRQRSPHPPIFRQSSKDGQEHATNGASGYQNPAQRRANDSAYDEPTEDDWIRKDNLSPKRRITIGDTLVKENHIRQLAQEAEDEDDAEDDVGDANVDKDEEDEDGDEDEDDNEEEDDNNEDDEDDEDDDDDEDVDEDETECGSFEADDGYHTDEETGFADSEDEDDGLNLWNHGIQLAVDPSPGYQGPQRRASATEHHSDSSTAPGQGPTGIRRRKPRQIPNNDAPSELPDSTDFVCGTFDEDRPMEEAYLSRRAALKAQKVHLIPQDIDPSFPTSDIEDGDGEELFNPVHHDSEDELWRMDDVHGDHDRTSRKRAKGASPRRYRSPPPKLRGRSPRAPDRRSPRRARSPCPKRAPLGVSPINGGTVKFAGLGVRGGFPQTKSLPRPAAMLTLVRQGKKPRVPTSDTHVRGAIDIVKGLERKRQRRREKYHHKYCNRARRGQVPERKAMPAGQGATKMRELGLLMAGKTDRGNYVMSV